jgi:23S rRNA (uracil1939-C5)-methyltransferase
MSRHVVERLGQRGDGIVAADDGNRHVPKVLPGETIDLAGSRLMRVIEPSPERVPAFCEHYDTCGGCKFQHWREDSYRQWKAEQVAQVLAGQGLTPDIAPLVDAHGEGRRRVSFHVRKTEAGWRAGFMEQKSHDLVPIDRCPVLAPALRDSPALAAEFGALFGECDVLLTAADNGIDVAVKAERKATDKRMPALSSLFQANNLLRLAVNGEVAVMAAPPVVRMGAASVSLPVQSFLQATAAGEEALARLVLESKPKRARNVTDLFSGLGTFALRLAVIMPVSAYDSDRPAIDAMIKATRMTQGLKPLTAAARNLFNAPLTPLELKECDWVVLDPPRAGADAQCVMLVKSAVKHVTYVSCDPQSFGRDAKILAQGGFSLRLVTPVDQFKWTAHTELVGVFSRK